MNNYHEFLRIFGVFFEDPSYLFKFSEVLEIKKLKVV